MSEDDESYGFKNNPFLKNSKLRAKSEDLHRQRSGEGDTGTGTGSTGAAIGNSSSIRDNPFMKPSAKVSVAPKPEAILESSAEDATTDINKSASEETDTLGSIRDNPFIKRNSATASADASTTGSKAAVPLRALISSDDADSIVAVAENPFIKRNSVVTVPPVTTTAQGSKPAVPLRELLSADAQDAPSEDAIVSVADNPFIKRNSVHSKPPPTVPVSAPVTTQAPPVEKKPFQAPVTTPAAPIETKPPQAPAPAELSPLPHDDEQKAAARELELLQEAEDDAQHCADAQELQLIQELRRAQAALDEFRRREALRSEAVEERREALLALATRPDKSISAADARVERLRRLGIPLEHIERKMEMQGVGHTSPAPTRATKLPLGDHPVYAKYLAQLTADHSNLDAIRTAMDKAHVNTAFLLLDPASLVDATVSVRRDAPLFDHPVYGKYFQMKNEGQDVASIAALMKRDGVDASFIHKKATDVVSYYIEVDVATAERLSHRNISPATTPEEGDTRRLKTLLNPLKTKVTGVDKRKTVWNDEEGDDIPMDMQEFETLFRKSI